MTNHGLITGVGPQGVPASKEPEDSSEGSKGELSASTAADAAVLDALYGDLPPYQPKAAERSEVVEATAPKVSSRPGEVPTILPTVGLRVITNPTSPTLVIEPAAQEVVASPSFAVAGVLISMRTPPRSPLACPAAVNVPVAPSTVASTRLVDFSEVARLPEVAEVENDFIGDMVDSFYKGLGRSIDLVLKGSTMSFSTLKVVL